MNVKSKRQRREICHRGCLRAKGAKSVIAGVFAPKARNLSSQVSSRQRREICHRRCLRANGAKYVSQGQALSRGEVRRPWITKVI